MQRDLITRLKSRKLWLSVANFISMIMIYFGADKNEAAQVAAIIMAGASIIGYVIGEGMADSSDVFIEEEEILGETNEEITE